LYAPGECLFEPAEGEPPRILAQARVVV